MVLFNKCIIDSTGKYLDISATVDNLDFYKNVYIKSIIIDTDETYSDTGPSSNEDGTYGIKQIDLSKSSKSIAVRVSAKDLKLESLDNNILFVYILTEGAPSIDTPCGMDNRFPVAVAVNLRSMYNTAMSYIKSIGSSCSIPKEFIDLILRLKAFELALKTGNYLTAIKYWKKFINKGTIGSTKTCGCNGLN